MKHIHIIAILIIVGSAVSCTKTSPPGDISSVDVEMYKNDTFPDALHDAEQVSDINSESVSNYLNSLLDSLSVERYIADKYNADSIYNDLVRFYELKDMKLAWYNENKPEKATEIMLRHLLNANQYALDSSAYDVFKIANLQNRVYTRDQVRLPELVILDIRTSIAFITFARHLQNGRYTPQVEKGLWLKPAENYSVANTLASEPADEMADKLSPAVDHYQSTLEALQKYKQIVRDGGWESLPSDLMLSKGDSGAHVYAIKQHLKMTGDFQNDPQDSVFTEELEQAVRKFQKRHDLEEDGIVGNTTLLKLNMPAEEIVTILEKNIERMRWMPDEPEKNHIVINIPEYLLTVVENDREIMKMDVIVGTEENKTPVFHDHLEYIVFSPTWTVPKSIVEKEMMPKIKEDPEYLEERDYKVFASWKEDAEELDPEDVDWDEMTADSVMIVQNPGTTNSLGRVKFMMPNSVSIYLHDTPANHLFSEADRAFSHGCIRVEKPIEFATYLLRNNEEWDNEKIRESLDLDEPKDVSLDEHVPVYIIYRTAWAEPDGTVQFREDVYGFDKQETTVKYATR